MTAPAAVGRGPDLPKLADRGPGAPEVCERIVGLHRRLRSAGTLAPAPGIDELFHELVATCVRQDEALAQSVLADPRIDRLRPELLRLCSEGEAELEKAWARRILRAEDPRAELATFPYLGNYEQLTRLELHSLAGIDFGSARPRQVCFVGGGALPLSPLLMRRATGATTAVVDNDPVAVDLARRVTERLEPGAGIRVVRADATSPADMAEILPGCDVVVLAALVGLTPERKAAVLRAVGDAMDAGAHLVVRSAHGLRSLLYPVVDLRDVSEGADCVPQILVHPLGEVVNSVVVARRR